MDDTPKSPPFTLPRTLQTTGAYTIQRSGSSTDMADALRAAYIGRRKYPFEVMEVGDMFFIPHKDKNHISSYLSNVGKELGRKYASRIIMMIATPTGEWRLAPHALVEGAVKGIGVWRTE